jgi:TPR repeat protein
MGAMIASPLLPRPAALAHSLAAVGLAALAAAAGCANVRPVYLAPSGVALAPRDYKLVKRGATARTCATFFLGLGSGDLSYAATLKLLEKEVPTDAVADYQLVNVVHDHSVDFYLLAWKRCTIITADVVKLADVAAPAPAAAPAAVAPPAAAAPAENAASAEPAASGPCTTAQACDARCRRGHVPSCSAAGVFYLEGKGVSKDETKALTLFKRACDESDPPACRHLGSMYKNGQWVPKDDGQAAKLHQRACDLGDGVACRVLSGWVAAGEGVPKDARKARQLKAKACKNGDQESCGK